MSDDDDLDVERLVDLLRQGREYVTGFKRAVVEDGGNEDLLALADDLWELLDEVEDVLGTIDFEELPDAIDVKKLPDAVDLDDVPEGLLDENETAIDLSDLREAVNLRELWEAVDLTQLREEKAELEDAADDVTEPVTGEEANSTDGNDDGLFQNVVGVGEGARAGVGASVSQAVLEEKIEDAVAAFRETLLSTHDLLRELYEANQEKLGQPGRQSDSLNPTAYSSLPPGPVPDSASTRTSTVPARVKYSRVDPPRRVYGNRFEEAREGERSQAEDAQAKRGTEQAQEDDE